MTSRFFSGLISFARRRRLVFALIGACLWLILGWDLAAHKFSVSVSASMVKVGDTLVSNSTSIRYGSPFTPPDLSAFAFYLVAGFILIVFGTEQSH